MKVIRIDEVDEEDHSHRPIFVGGKVTMNRLVGEEATTYYNFNNVNFAAGARTRFHTHTSDQILYVTEGRGKVATAAEEVDIAEGDTAFIPAGEKHWHGATSDSDFSHISLTTPDSVTEVFD